MAVEIKFGHENFANYKRLSYKWWFAFAEFVDNSTQSFSDNEDSLRDALKAERERFSVVISTGQDFVRVSDNGDGDGTRRLRTSNGSWRAAGGF